VQSLPITTNVVSSNLAHGKVYSIQHYVIKFVSDLSGLRFFPSTPVSSTNKTDRHDITEILLKVALNTINHYRFIIKLNDNIKYHGQFNLIFTCIEMKLIDRFSNPIVQ
jgi:hypothetical protein